MKTIHKYVASNFLITFLMTLVVFTFVMTIGIIFGITDLLARGVSWKPICLILLWGIPTALEFSIPISSLTTSLLVFGRLSADGEITAMRASGISLRQIISPCVLLSLLFMIVCMYTNADLAPLGHIAQRAIIAKLGAESPAKLLEEGRFIHDFKGLTIYIEKKRGDRLKDIRIYDMREKGVRREIQAETGTIKAGANKGDIAIELLNGHVDPVYTDTPGRGEFGKLTILIENAFRNGNQTQRKRVDSMTMLELIDYIRKPVENLQAFGRELAARVRMGFIVEANKRLALSTASFAFVLLGIPLGIVAHRKESSIGVGISLFLVFNFYLFLIVGESLANNPKAYPYLIVWLPVIISVIIGAWLVHRAD